MNSKPKSLKEIYLVHLNNLYSAENQISETLPTLIKFVNSPFLKKELEYQLKETEIRVNQLERLFEVLEKKGKNYKNGRVEISSQKNEQNIWEKNLPSNQVGTIFTSKNNAIDSPQISSPYGTLRTIADLLGEKEAVELLTEMLDEENSTNLNLTEVGMIVVQIGALQDSEK